MISVFRVHGRLNDTAFFCCCIHDVQSFLPCLQIIENLLFVKGLTQGELGYLFAEEKTSKLLYPVFSLVAGCARPRSLQTLIVTTQERKNTKVTVHAESGQIDS